MSTEAMRQQEFEEWYAEEFAIFNGCESDKMRAFRIWQAASANNEALIKAAIEACAKECEISIAHAEKHYGVAEGVGAHMCLRAVREITVQQVMERVKCL